MSLDNSLSSEQLGKEPHNIKLLPKNKVEYVTYQRYHKNVTWSRISTNQKKFLIKRINLRTVFCKDKLVIPALSSLSIANVAHEWNIQKWPLLQLFTHDEQGTVTWYPTMFPLKYKEMTLYSITFRERIRNVTAISWVTLTKNSPSQTRDVFDFTITILCWIIWTNELYCTINTMKFNTIRGRIERIQNKADIYPSGGKSVE